VSFPNILLARVSDEFLYSVEDEKRVGNTSDGFAYIVTDGKLLNDVPDAAKLTYKSLKQYVFISLGTCLEVIAKNPPVIGLAELRTNV
jgi:hypothetical protein